MSYICKLCGKELEQWQLGEHVETHDLGTVAEENAKLRTELKNFLAAFDEYWERAIYTESTLNRVVDAKQAMFSAANQARKVLG